MLLNAEKYMVATFTVSPELLRQNQQGQRREGGGGGLNYPLHPD